MAWTPTLLGLPLLLLPLLSLFWASTRAGDRKVVLLAPPEVRGSPGDTVNLTCVLQPVESEIPQVKQIRWEKLDSWGYLSTVAEFDWDQGPNITEPNRVQFISAGKDPDVLDASLTLTELHPDDDANYTCEVTTFLQGSGRASTWVRVFYAPQVSISLYDDFDPQGHRETSLSCDARGNPEPRNYEWSTTMGLLPPSAVPQGSWLLLQPSEESINVTFICRVSNNLGSAQATIIVLLPGPSIEQSRSRSRLALTIFPIVVVVMAFGILIYFLCFRKSGEPQEPNVSWKSNQDEPCERMSLGPL